MSKQKNNNDFNMGNIFTIMCGLIVSLYFCYLTIEPLMYKKTNGMFLSYNEVKSEKTEYYPSKNKGYTKSVKEYTSYEYLYEYNVNGLKFNGTKYSRMIIYPDIKFDIGNITVYVNRFDSNKSILVPLTIKYWLINNILFIMFWLIVLKHYLYKRKQMKKSLIGINKKTMYTTIYK